MGPPVYDVWVAVDFSIFWSRIRQKQKQIENSTLVDNSFFVVRSIFIGVQVFTSVFLCRGKLARKNFN